MDMDVGGTGNHNNGIKTRPEEQKKGRGNIIYSIRIHMPLDFPPCHFLQLLFLHFTDETKKRMIANNPGKKKMREISEREGVMVMESRNGDE